MLARLHGCESLFRPGYVVRRRTRGGLEGVTNALQNSPILCGQIAKSSRIELHGVFCFYVRADGTHDCMGTFLEIVYGVGSSSSIDVFQGLRSRLQMNVDTSRHFFELSSP